jgi:hypothetical protein
MNISAQDELEALAYVKNYFIKNGVSIVYCPATKMFATYLDLPPSQLGGNVDKNTYGISTNADRIKPF